VSQETKTCTADDITWWSKPDAPNKNLYWATCACGWHSTTTRDIHRRTIESKLHLERKL
jgi:hypothetical protein